MMREHYEIVGNKFEIVDEELEIDLCAGLEFLDKGHFPGGSLRYETYRKGEQLHGPSTYYGKNGEILSRSWYYEGQKVGKSWRYYPNGKLYSLEKYVDGVFHGVQEYYYIDGSVKTIIPYEKGVFHGKVQLFWPDGTKKRECVFVKGEKQEDRFYNEKGILAESLS